MNIPENQINFLEAPEIYKSFGDVYAMEATTKMQLKMQQKQLDHQRVVMDLKIQNLSLCQQVNDKEQRLEWSECSNKLLEMQIEKMKSDKQFLQSKIKICQDQAKNEEIRLKQKLRGKEQQYSGKIQQMEKKSKDQKQSLSRQIQTITSKHKQQTQQFQKQIDGLTDENKYLREVLAQEKAKNETLQKQRRLVVESLEENFKNFLEFVDVQESHELICLVKQKLDACQTEIKDARVSLNKFKGSQGFNENSLNHIIEGIHQDLQSSKATIENMRNQRYQISNEVLQQLGEGYKVDNPDEILLVLQSQIKIHVGKFKALQSQAQKLKSEKQKLENKTKQNEEQLNELREIQRKLREQVNLLQKEVNNSIQKTKQVNQQIDQLKTKLFKCQQLVKQKEIQNKLADSKIQNNLDVLKAKQQDLQRYKDQLQKVRQSQQQKQQAIQRHVKLVSELNQKVDTQQNQIQRLEDKSNRLSQQSENYQSQLSRIKKESEDFKSQANGKISNYEQKTKSSQGKLQQMQRQLANLANKHIRAHLSQQEAEIESYHQALQYFQNLTSPSSASKKQDLFSVPSLSKSFESQENWIKNLISQYSNSNTFTSQFVARFEFISPRDLETYLGEPNTLLICQTSFKKVFAIFICKLSKLIKDVDPVVIFSSDCPLAYPSQPTKGEKCRPAMIISNNLCLVKKQIVIQKSLQVSLESGEYFGEIDKYKLFGIEDNSSKFKIEKMEIHRIITEQ